MVRKYVTALESITMTAIIIPKANIKGKIHKMNFLLQYFEVKD